VTDQNQQTQSDFRGLDTRIDPRLRCFTSFFTLACDIAADAGLLKSGVLSEADDGRGGTLRLWANRPGQSGVETLTLALLSFWATLGITVDLITCLLPQQWWSWPTLMVLAPIISFAALHLFTLIIALLGAGIRGLGIAPKISSERVTSLLSIFGMTVIALIALQTGRWLTITAGLPWLVWAALNFLAWAMLLARNLFRSLGDLD